ncbi:MAG: PEP-CTERM sorting domain-containing protein [Planctomycetaceae bacterium]|nr:PEP-CTERM sorting domain-containing protein [Planctomycetaceae bacterium]
MYRLVFCCLIALLAGTARQAAAHGIPVIISADANQQIHTDSLVYSNGVFQLLGGVLLTTDLPGYSVVNSKQGISFGTTLRLNVVDQLLWWQNGKVRLDSAQTLNLINPEGDSISVSKDTVFHGGFPIEFYDSTPGWHEHVDYTFASPSAPVGAYGLLMQVTAAGYQKSANFLLVFNNGLAAGQLATAVSDLSKAEFQEPGDANSDGIVDGADYTIWADHYLQTVTWRYGNFNFDGIVDGADYTVWADNYAPASLAAAAVPEPATLVSALVGAGLLAVAASRRRRPPTP